MVTLLLEALENLDTYKKPFFWQKRKTQIFVYGTGNMGQDVYRILSKRCIPISGYMDHRSREKPYLNGVPVFSPDDASLPQEKRSEANIILAIHNREVDMPALISRLKLLGYAHFISMIDLYDHFAAELGTRYWLTSRTFYRDFEAQIGAVYNLWADSLSRELYAETLKFRITGDFSLLPEPDMEHQYFPPDLPPWKQPLRLIDCGAYNGDTLKSIKLLGIPLEAVAAYEPDEVNFRKLADYVHENNIPMATLWPCGVYSSTTQLHFFTGQDEASVISGNGESVIQCISLDESTPDFAPTLIKLDIEGAEYDALLGARHLIATYQPGLAISTYHTPAHLWEIPLWVAQFAAENKLHYTYHLRSHARNCFDTVFYAVPSP